MRKRCGFTLIELLVVVAIIALLIGILVPAIGRARELAKGTRCLANLSGIGKGLLMYSDLNDGFVIPSYNMPPGTYQGTAGQVFDGWPAILERDGVVAASGGLINNIFYCPNTEGIDGMAGGQTAYDQIKPQGYQDWPVQFLTAGGDGATKGDPVLPMAGFGDSNGLYLHNIRCGYWLNAQNPIGSSPAATASAPACPYYTQTVGYGPYGDGSSLGLVKANTFSRPSALIVASDGMYMGRQSVVRLGEANRRIGYRHLGKQVTVVVNGVSMSFTKTISNAVFADGHAEPINNADFPHANVQAENTGNYSVLAAP